MNNLTTKKSFPKKRVTALVIVIVILFASWWGIHAYISDYYHAKERALAYITEENENITVTETEDQQIVFAPQNPTAGIIFYPGAKVEYEAYAPLLYRLAENNILCVLIHMPGNMAILDIAAAEGIQEQFPQVEHWYMAGHSLGGAMAANYIEKHAGKFEGLILLAAYSTKDLSQSNLKVCCIYGSNDDVLSKETYEKNLANLPTDYAEFVIEGGCHAYFGDYGPQDGDGTPTISIYEQMDETVDYITSYFML